MDNSAKSGAYAGLKSMEIHPLTGLYYNAAFFKRVETYIKRLKPGAYMMVAVDMEHFRLFNKLYGREQGNQLLIHIADCLKQLEPLYGAVAGYLGGDNFGILLPKKMDILKKLQDDIMKGIEKTKNTVGFMVAFGMYTVEDISVSPINMYDCATIALSHVVGNYSNRMCEYNVDMEEKLEEEIKILSDIQNGIKNEEFTFYVQPQCDISTGKVVGGESLVRWRHEGGMISPGVFVPILEKNGFIADLDRYVWRKVCQWLRDWIDRGHKPVPISINVSRIDIFSMDVPAYLTELIRTYELQPSLIKVEITESAYADNNDKIVRTVKQLRDLSFLVMMDDFGSGYSSLNMLKSVSVDVLKIDMCFLDINEREEEKGIGILESVVNMARQMKLPIIVEGVETQRQENFLQKMGCRYIQGYYYYKPLPVEEFENLIADERNVDYEGIWCKQVEQMHVREFLDANLFSDVMVNNILGAAAFYEMYENRIEITRVNEQYYKMAGIHSGKEAENVKKLWNHVRDDDRQLLFSVFEQAYQNPVEGAEGYIHYVRDDGQVLWVYMRVFFLRERDGHKLFYSSLRDMTEFHHSRKRNAICERVAEEFSESQKTQIERYYSNLPCGFAIAKIILDDSAQPNDYEIIYANRQMSKISGESLERLRYLLQRTFAYNKEEILDKAYRAAYLGEIVEHQVHSELSQRYLKLTLYQYEYGYVGCTLSDVTHYHIYENALDNIMRTYREVYFVHLHDNYCRMIYPDDAHLMERGNYEEVINRHFSMGRIVSQDQKGAREFFALKNLMDSLMIKDVVEHRYRRRIEGKGEEWCQATFSVSERKDGIPRTAILTIRSIESLMREKEEKKRQYMAETMANMSEGFFIYSALGKEKLLYANPAVMKIYGCDTIEEFRDLVENSFRGMVHPEDLERIEAEIDDQIRYSDRNMDYICYRIRRKDGEIRWIDDCGHMEEFGVNGENKLFYVFISDITDKMDNREKERLIALSQTYNV